MKFRYLKPDEIQVRVNSINKTGTGWSVLLYKDARCDMEILDETVTAMGWKREHSRDNANCTVSIWDEKKEMWIGKEDTGAESYTEKEKGLASDSFKRACFNWGIGRELYTAPFIWIVAKQGEIYQRKDGKFSVDNKVHLYVDHIKTEDGKIQELRIIDKQGDIRFSYGILNEKAKNPDDNKPWLDESDKETFTKAEEWVKEGNDPAKLRNKYKVSKSNMKHFVSLHNQST